MSPHAGLLVVYHSLHGCGNVPGLRHVCDTLPFSSRVQLLHPHCFLVATMSWTKRPEPYQEFIDNCKSGPVHGAPWTLKIWEITDSEITI